MAKLRTTALIAALAVTAAGVTAANAHHSVSAQFRVDDPVQFAPAKLKRVEWINPHPYLTFELKGPDGVVQDWAMESMAPAALRRAGLSGREALKVGETYTVYYNPARNGKPIGLLMAFTLPDGKTVGALSQQAINSIRARQAN
jgi:hypothetical protein